MKRRDAEARRSGAWRNVQLGDVCEIQLGKMLSPISKRGIRPIAYLRNANVQWDRFDLRDVATMDFDERQEEKFSLRPNDLLVCEGGEPGRAAIWNGEIERCCYQKALHRLRPISSEVDPHFIMYRLWLGAFVNEFSDSMTKSTISHLPANRLAKLVVAIPPVDEQRRIAARLREQLAAVSQARAALEAQLAAADALPAANLRAVFQSPLAQRWPRVKMDELCEIVAAQVNPTLPEFSALPHVSGENIESGMCRLRAVRSAAEDGMMSGKYLVEPGDVLYSKLRPYLRKVAIAPFRGLCSADMYPIRVNKNRFDARFAAWLLLSEDFTKYAVGASQRSRMPKLNREQLFAWHAPTPPLAEQRAIAAQLDTELSAALALRAALAAKLSEVEKLPAALLRAAFQSSR